MRPRPYRIGEVVLLEWQGWLKAFRVVGAVQCGDMVEYALSMVELEGQVPSWTRPAR